MKTFACVLLLAAVVASQPPRFREVRFGRQELGEAPQSEDAPYPAAGFRPNKEFKLPSREETAPPSTNYGVPDDSYGAPLTTYLSPEYGLPEGEARESKNETEAESVTEGGEKVEKKENLEEQPKSDAEIVSNQGSYYVLLPGSQLQRVQFQTENDLRNMAYTARLQYRNEDSAPLYVYTAVPQYQPAAAAYVQLY